MESLLFSSAPLAVLPSASNLRSTNAPTSRSDAKLLTIETSIQPLSSSTATATPTTTPTSKAAEPCHDNASTCTCTTASGNAEPASPAPEQDDHHHDSDSDHLAADESHKYSKSTATATTAKKTYASIPPEVAAHLVAKTAARVEHSLAKAVFLQQPASKQRLAQLTKYRIGDQDEQDHNPRVLLMSSSRGDETVQEEVCCDDDDTDVLPTVQVGELVAAGGFATVHHVTLSDLDLNNNNSQKQTSDLDLNNNSSSSHKKKTYVIKHLSARLAAPPMTAYEKQEHQQFYRHYSKEQPHNTPFNNRHQHKKLDKNHPYKKLFLGAKDLVLEAHVLAALAPHDHIVECRGWSGFNDEGTVAYETTLRTDAFFLILENLEGGTLAQKLRHWRTEQWHLQKDREVHNRQQRAKVWGRIQSLWRRPSNENKHHHYHHRRPSSEFSSSLTDDDVMGSSNNYFNATTGVELALKSSDPQNEDKHPHHKSKKLAVLKEKIQRQEFFQERLEFAVDLADALAHMHQRRIMHRDLKPANIGFDLEGRLKLFDFGLAKELPPKEEGTPFSHPCHCAVPGYQSRGHSVPNDIKAGKGPSTSTVFHLPGNTGTCRYMAPEVIRREAYNQQIDVYSFSIVLWELMSLQKPYGNDVSGNYVKECVAVYGDRPNILRQWKPHWPQQDAMTKILRQGWARDITARPTMVQYQAELMGLIATSKSKVQSLQQRQEQLGLPEDASHRTCSSSSKMETNQRQVSC